MLHAMFGFQVFLEEPLQAQAVKLDKLRSQDLGRARVPVVLAALVAAPPQ
jgi:hypothetical protein